jgi:hypothetical protein
MNFKPVDELSLRHLFSSNFSKEILRLSYIGPVLNPGGSIETSPDCMILDRRKHPYGILRCEFKYVPSGKEDFVHNGQFDLAVVWALPSSLKREQLLSGLLSQNGCIELIVLNELKAFRELPDYNPHSLSCLRGLDIVKEIALKRDFPSVFSLCIAAKAYPDKFEMNAMVELLSKRFSEIKKMRPQGRSNVVSAFLQTKPPLLTWMHGKFYRWTNEIDSESASAELTQLIRTNFAKEPPNGDDVNAVRG